ncbi:hypothetical protein ACJJTC_012195 [Scirpophaga incertulas]
MPPKTKDPTSKKLPTQIARPPISESSLFLIPEDAVEGYQDRIYDGINWTLLEQAARYHKEKSLSCNSLKGFSEALQAKINDSIFNGFFNEERYFLWRELKSTSTLRLNDTQMTELDQKLLEFDHLATLNLGNNYLTTLGDKCVPRSIRALELQGNKICNVNSFVETLPSELLYLGLSRNFLKDEFVEPICRLPYQLTVLDLSDNDIYQLEPVLSALEKLPNLRALQLAGNPCAVCCAYPRATLSKLPQLQWLDCREVLPYDRPIEASECHPDDLRSAYFTFIVIRVMSAPQPPKIEKGATATFHVELELPLLDAIRRTFLMHRTPESLVEMLQPAEDDTWSDKEVFPLVENKSIVGAGVSPHPSDIYKHLTTKNSREILHFTTFESNRVPWNKIMIFHEPALRIFCPDLVTLRDTFRTTITLRLIYSLTMAGKQGKKSNHTLRQPVEQRMVLATIKCALRQPDWNKPSQHFHWDDSLGSSDALHWKDGDLSIIQYNQGPFKPVKGKQEQETSQSRQLPPENLTCHFGFGIEFLK